MIISFTTIDTSPGQSFFSPPEPVANYRQFFMESVVSDKAFGQYYLSALRRIDRHQVNPTFNERIRITGDYADELTVILFDESGRKQFQSDLKHHVAIHQHAQTHLERHNRKQSKVNIAPEDIEYSDFVSDDKNVPASAAKLPPTSQQKRPGNEPATANSADATESQRASKESFMEQFRQSNKL